ncbi:MAG: hypothetical protein M1832_005724 [Thelocarpon impressellum]|nr:MAG: hypothetical protein M1832_005724 [Thelocarpon impressellum]
MNTIREIQALNKREIEAGVSPEASWHADYRDTAWVYVGGLPFELSEGDVVTIVSQYGEPVHISMPRDKETGKSRGFAFVKYEDQRSTDLAVDNLGGATVMGRTLKIDHTRYKRKEEDGDGDNLVGVIERPGDAFEDSASEEKRRPMLKEELELAALMRDHDDDDPMKEYIVSEKRAEVSRALAVREGGKKRQKHHGDGKSEHRHRRHRHRDRSRDGRDEGDGRSRRRREKERSDRRSE